ncbi:FAD-dependent monooxygenase [Arthrobacter crusticola]|uniref:FAD-dependent monooxygenase n=1 Tax=Arthrobacter crusticola TaxID=2547960 RepID=A0A4R5TZ10_9MICC|nr:NAD(P)/FAD-dependent oxidoreductase [Arthrobacter crusticola]TDK26460.1 FAD-dependent monooxygenase [Arthrobacter crusticola]
MHDVVVVGGGPVGLYAALELRRAGLDVVALERRTARSGHSRAIGIHPPALAALKAGDVAGALESRGVRITEGIARSAGRQVASLSFAGLPGEHGYVLAVPQAVTEEVLEDRLAGRYPGTLRRGTTVTGLAERDDRVEVHAVAPGGADIFEARCVIGADGARSAVRDYAGIGAPGRSYPDCYLMGDFPDGTGDGDSAVLYLEAAGIVESFPLPGGVRRWVVRLGAPAEPDPHLLSRLIGQRTNVAVDPAGNTMVSSFEVRSRLAERLVAGRVLLVGDAAHEISPIGGQGMNLGWLDVQALVPLVTAHLREGTDVGQQLARFNRTRRRAAGVARRKAHLNMALGRPLPPRVLAARNAALAHLLSRPAVSSGIARAFTMQ